MVALDLCSLLRDLNRYEDRIPFDELKKAVAMLEIDEADYAEYVHFRPECYTRNLIHQGSAYIALLLCWKNGQRSPIHDHRGSHCAFRVLKGTATESLFEPGPNGMVYPTGSRHHPAGSVCGSSDMDMHQVSNLQPDDLELITLHIYSPPLRVMGTYSLSDAKINDFVDPVFEFSLGGGI